MIAVPAPVSCNTSRVNPLHVREKIQHSLNVFRSQVKMRGSTNPSLPGSGKNPILPHAGHQHPAVDFWMLKRDDAGTAGRSSLNHHFVTFLAHTRLQHLRERIHSRRDLIHAYLQQKFDGATQSEAPYRV